MSSWLCFPCTQEALPFVSFGDEGDSDYPNIAPLTDTNKSLLGNTQSISDHFLSIPNVCKYYSLEEFNSDPIDSNFDLFHLNCRSLNRNFDKIVDYLSVLKNNFSVLGFTETWLTNNISPLVHLDNYTIVESHRSSRRGGGVCLFVRQDYTYVERPDLSNFDDSIESLFIEISIPVVCKSVVVGVVYRPPNGNTGVFNDCIHDSLCKISNEKNYCFILGDYNIDLLSNRSTDFLNTLTSCGFCPTISRPTRVTDHSSSLIDNILTNITSYNEAEVRSAGILITDITDHFPIYLSTQIGNIKQVNNDNLIQSFSLRNVNNFVNAISATNWYHVLDEGDANVAFDMFYDTFKITYDACFPYVRIKNNKSKQNRAPWITSGILKSIKRKDKLYRNYLKTPSPEKWSYYRKFRNKLNHVIRIAKKHHYVEKFTECRNDSKETWKTINRFIKGGKSSTMPNTFVKDGCNITGSGNIANEFNNFFVNLGPSLAEKIPRVPFTNYSMGIPNPSSLFLFPTTEEEVIKISYECLNSRKAAGFDCIRPKIVREVIPFIAQPLTHIFNISFMTSTFPDHLKKAKVVPVFKKGNVDNFCNYRPISILPCFSKVLERLMFNRLNSFLSDHNILSNCQYGFRSGHSTELALIDAVDKLHSALQSKKQSIGIFLDLSKAFDTIDHQILLQKLSHYGVRGSVNLWFKSYLSSRQQFTTVNNVHSNFLDISCGVPQGSILGPLLFIIYVNDICNVSKSCSLVLFADDTNIFFTDSHDNLENIVNGELSKFYAWFVTNKLSLNVDKTNFMVFSIGKNCNNFNISMNNVPLERVKRAKFLGVYIDDKLSWGDHISYVATQVSKGVGILAKLKFTLPLKALRLIYLSLILPQLSYCCSVWSGANKSILNKLLILQKRAVRHITCSASRDPTSSLFASLNLLKLPDVITLSLVIFTYRCLNNLLPTSFSTFYTTDSHVHPYYTRQSANPHPVLVNLNNHKRSLKYRSISIWNSLPPNFWSKPSIASLRKGLSSYFLNSY